MHVAIVSLGTELVTGDTLDTNASWLAGELTILGATVGGIEVVPDDLDAITETFRRRAAGADLLLVTGGLGPTEDDLTRRAIAAVLGTELALHEPSLDRIRAFFEARGRTMAESNRVQAMIPIGGHAIENDNGTAPGIRAVLDRTTLIAMPGVPSEMRRMFDAAVRPLVAGRAGVTLRAQVHTFGATESELGAKIADLMERGRNPDVGTTAKSALITVRILSHGDDDASARARLERDVDEVRRRLGPLVVGRDDETLSVAVGRLLASRGDVVCTAESCTAGMIAKRLTDVPGSSAWFTHGYVTYSNRAKGELLGVSDATLNRHGAVSAETVAEMARGARERSGADWAIAVSGIAGPGGGTEAKPVGLVHFGIAGAADTIVREVRWGDSMSRGEVRTRSASAALNQLRLALLRADPARR